MMRRTPAPPRPPRRQRGAALLTAMVIVTVVSALAAGMVWQQWKAVQVETAERARAQSYWLLTGALDWARLILREDRISSNIDHLGEPWAVPLAEARLATFLAADKDNTDLADIDAFLSGRIEDLQARYNLRNLIDKGKVLTDEYKILQRLCELAKVPAGTAETLAEGMLRSQAQIVTPADGASSQTQQVTEAVTAGTAGTLLPPRTVDDLIWLGLNAQTVEQLRPFVTLLQPGKRTTVNVNTAGKEVLAAVTGLDQGTVQRLIQTRQSKPFKEMSETGLAPDNVNGGPEGKPRVGFVSDNFEVQGRLRYDNLVIEERSMVVREGRRTVKTWHRERINTVLPGGPAP